MGKIFKRPQPETVLPSTGERLTPGLTGQTEIEHLHRYFLARTMSESVDVLDVASGEGYGAALLAQVAKSVIGVEIASEAVAHAKEAYISSNLQFIRSDARTLPLSDASVDLVVSFETIEHFDQHDQFLTEIRRVLRAGGRLIISTPDRDNYSLAGAPANPFHVLEMTRAEFLELLHRHFAYVACWEQRPMIGSVMFAASPSTINSVPAPLCFERRGDHFEESSHLARPQYIVAVASDRPFEGLPDTVYIEASQFGAYDQEIIRAEAARRADTEAAYAALQTQVAVLERLNARAEEAHGVLRERIEGSIAHLAHLDGEIAKRDMIIADLRAEVARRDQAIADLRAEAAQSVANLRAEVAHRDQRISDLKAKRISGRLKTLRRRLTGRR